MEFIQSTRRIRNDEPMGYASASVDKIPPKLRMIQENEWFTFPGIGTSWCVLVDGETLREDARSRILEFVRVFNARFSRFLNSSEVNAYRGADAGEYLISEEFAILLSRADELRRLTGGVYDPAVGGLLEQAGYDRTYSMAPRPETAEFILPKWELAGQTLVIDSPVVFDFGGMGKGYCIDKIAGILEDFGYRHYMVDGGGDIYATSKRGGEPWRVALEYPGKPDIAAGVVEFENQGLAVSDIFRRRWKGWHHIVNPHSRTPIENVVGVAALARSAWEADCATSALFLADENSYPEIAKLLNSHYVVFHGDGTARVSPDWEGELFL